MGILHARIWCMQEETRTNINITTTTQTHPTLAINSISNYPFRTTHLNTRSLRSHHDTGAIIWPRAVGTESVASTRTTTIFIFTSTMATKHDPFKVVNGSTAISASQVEQLQTYFLVYIASFSNWNTSTIYFPYYGYTTIFRISFQNNKIVYDRALEPYMYPISFFLLYVVFSQRLFVGAVFCAKWPPHLNELKVQGIHNFAIMIRLIIHSIIWC